MCNTQQLVEECEERLSDEKIDELIALVDTKLPPPASLLQERSVSEGQPEVAESEPALELISGNVSMEMDNQASESYMEPAEVDAAPEEELVQHGVESNDDDYDDGGDDE
jgi:hypothetical protein